MILETGSLIPKRKKAHTKICCARGNLPLLRGSEEAGLWLQELANSRAVSPAVTDHRLAVQFVTDGAC